VHRNAGWLVDDEHQPVAMQQSADELFRSHATGYPREGLAPSSGDAHLMTFPRAVSR
jgi:hypothetical protein